MCTKVLSQFFYLKYFPKVFYPTWKSFPQHLSSKIISVRSCSFDPKKPLSQKQKSLANTIKTGSPNLSEANLTIRVIQYLPSKNKNNYLSKQKKKNKTKQANRDKKTLEWKRQGEWERGKTNKFWNRREQKQRLKQGATQWLNEWNAYNTNQKGRGHRAPKAKRVYR
jgi:hypothetical protein